MSKRASLVSLFAGAGGLDLGLEQAGFDTLAVSELEFHACETLRQNQNLSQLSLSDFDQWFENQMKQRCYSKISKKEYQILRDRIAPIPGIRAMLSNAKIFEGDIRSVSSLDLMAAAEVSRGELTLVAGGPPCQPFSRAGKRATVEAEDGRLFMEFVRVVNDMQPRWFLFENVKGLAQSRTLVPYCVCRQCSSQNLIPFVERTKALAGDLTFLKCENCQSDDVYIDSKDMRGGSLEIILAEFESIGYKCEHKILNSANFGVPQSRERLFIVGSRDNEKFTWPKETYYSPPTMAKFDQLDKQSQLQLLDSEISMQPRLTVADVLWLNGHPEFGELDTSRARLWVKNVVRPHDEAVTWSLNRPSPTVGAHQAAKLAIAPDGVPPEQLARQQWHTKGHRQRDLPPVDVRHAMLSDEDLLRLQTFPPNWYLYGTRMERAFQIGNAVPPILGKVMGEAILSACNNVSTNVNQVLKEYA